MTLADIQRLHEKSFGTFFDAAYATYAKREVDDSIFPSLDGVSFYFVESHIEPDSLRSGEREYRVWRFDALSGQIEPQYSYLAPDSLTAGRRQASRWARYGHS